jgi:hypothetical protein
MGGGFRAKHLRIQFPGSFSWVAFIGESNKIVVAKVML